MDSKTESILYSNACIFERNGDDVGIILHHHIPASFKDMSYNVSVAFSEKQGLVMATCGCPAGDDGSVSACKHGCVHVLCVPYLLSILLLDGLAKNFLCELSVCWKAVDDGLLMTDEREQMCQNIHTLMFAAQNALLC
jgi:hypothetical protein